MFLVALAIRIAVSAVMVPEFLDPFRDHWHFGWEMGRIARSICEGHGFSSPFFRSHHRDDGLLLRAGVAETPRKPQGSLGSPLTPTVVVLRDRCLLVPLPTVCHHK